MSRKKISAYTGLPEEFELNPVQIQVDEIAHREDCDIIVASETNSGKTACISIVGHKYIYGKNKKKIIYVAPMKALVEEKFNLWRNENHPYSKLNLDIITGDFLTPNGKDEDIIRNADIIVMTPESFASKINRVMAHSTESVFEDVGLLVIDEVHLVGEEQRGATLEAALIKFMHINSKAQLLGLSATVPNYGEFKTWFDNLNEKETIVISSDYRSVPLDFHFPRYDRASYQETVENKFSVIRTTIQENNQDQFLVVVFSKAFGDELQKHLAEYGITAEFHNANKSRPDRLSMEKRFTNGSLKVLLCTQTLIVGNNLPARRVIVTATKTAGGAIPAYTLRQASGRAGRAGFDTKGDAYFLIESGYGGSLDRKRILAGERIVSRFTHVSDVSFHFLAAVYSGLVKDSDDFHHWFMKTLAYAQSKTHHTKIFQLLDDISSLMQKYGMIVIKDDGFKITRRGSICTQMFVDPVYAYDLICNFNRYFALNSPKAADLAKALGAVRRYQAIYPKRAYPYVPKGIIKLVAPEYYDSTTVYYNQINNMNNPPMLNSLKYDICSDIERISLTLGRIARETNVFNEEEADILDSLKHRVLYGVSNSEALFAVQNGVTAKKARRIKALDT